MAADSRTEETGRRHDPWANYPKTVAGAYRMHWCALLVVSAFGFGSYLWWWYDEPELRVINLPTASVYPLGDQLTAIPIACLWS